MTENENENENENVKKIWYAPNKFEAYGDEEIKAVVECLQGGMLAGFNNYTIKFQEEVSKLFGKKYGLFVNSGSSANLLALLSLNLTAGTKILTPACTFSTTVSPIIQTNNIPIFCDVQLDEYVPSVNMVIKIMKEDPDIKVIMIPNLIGSVFRWEELKKELIKMNRSDVILIEDSCDTILCNTHSDISTTSFYASHIITSCGSGGMVMFNNEELLKRATMYRDWGRIGENTENMEERFTRSVDGIKYDYKFLYAVAGYNFKSSEVNASFGLVQLAKLNANITTRRLNYNQYIFRLMGVNELILPFEYFDYNWLAFPLQIKDEYSNILSRHELLTHLEDNNVQTRVLFSGNITRHPAFRSYLKEYKNADLIMKNGFLIGCHHGMTTQDVDRVCDLMLEYIEKKTRQ